MTNQIDVQTLIKLPSSMINVRINIANIRLYDL